MHDDRPIPSWNRRRLMRHLARRGSPMVVRWVCFGAAAREEPPAQPTRPYPDNVILLRPRAVACC